MNAGSVIAGLVFLGGLRLVAMIANRPRRAELAHKAQRPMKPDEHAH